MTDQPLRKSSQGRGAVGVALATLNRVAGLPLIDRFGLRKPTERAVFNATRTGFRTVGAVNRSFKATRKLHQPARLPAVAERPALLDLTPTDEQRMIQQTVQEFAAEQLRPAAAEADESCRTPPELLHSVNELGITLVGVPDEAGGIATERSAVTAALITEAMSHGDMGLAVSCLAPTAVSSALVRWGDRQQQEKYLPAFVGDNVPAAALTLLEPRPAFDPFTLRTTARRSGGGFVLNGVKSLVPRASEAELFLVAAELEGTGPALFLIESATAGLSVESEPAMGLRGAGMGRVLLDDVRLPPNALLAQGDQEAYAECVRSCRIAWSALAAGTAQAVLDYVVPYVNERHAFGEPISHRQGVAFRVADIGTELEGLRLATYRAASRAEQGLPHARETALARQLAARHGMDIGSDGVQLLGGHGFVKDHPVERWYRDLRAVGVAEGIVIV